MGNQVSTQVENRQVRLGYSEDWQFPDNKITTSKYTLLNFLPKNLYEQLRRLANVYFLIVALINLFISGPVSPIVYVVPVTLIMSATAVKQAYEDYCRHREDNVINMSSVTVLRRGCLLKIPCMDVHVGDIVCLNCEEDVPCDMVILLTSHLEGKCFITTANLDGETNLKVMERPIGLDLNLKDLGSLSGKIICENPTPNLYQFYGYIEIEENSRNSCSADLGILEQYNMAFLNSTENLELNSLPNGLSNEEFEGNSPKKKVPLSSTNVLLRGSRLKTTNYVYGCAVYTGQQTKLSLNLRLSKNKFSVIERTINWFLFIFFLLLLFEACLSCVCEWYYQENTDKFFYLGPPLQINLLLELFNYLVLYYYIIPVSMYTTLELQRFLGTVFIEKDKEMYRKGKYAMCKTSDLNEELGQVNYVFTDKTGTLTENEMKFQRCSINGKMYLEDDGELYLLTSNDVKSDPILAENWTQEIKEFFLGMVLCHTVQCDNQTYPVRYQASSADEKAFVEACARCKIMYMDTLQNTIRIDMQDKSKTFKRLEVLEFNSDRKRMSVIVMDENNTIWLICKGAESALEPLITDGFSDEDVKHLQEFSSKGLRTLVYGCRQLSLQEFKEGRQKLIEARSTLDNNNREILINSVIFYLESNLQILGIAAIEDRLQELVPETLTNLYAAGIKVWVLTGDKVETAKSIAYSCGHFKIGMELIHLIGLNSVESYLLRFNDFSQKINTDIHKQFGLVLDGTTLAIIMSHDPQPFMELALACSAVICCRLSPKQKAQIVSLAKHSKHRPTTLAIGDGANDISMIQEAHIGVGIMGNEGQQAVQCSDFAFAQFHCLTRVLLVHGHWYYFRTSNLILYFFYKNIVFITPQVYFAFGLSPQVLYNTFYLLFYNTIFTSIPIILYGLIEQDYSASALTKYPVLYKKISNNKLNSFKNFMQWVLTGAWHSAVIYFIPFLGTYVYDIDLENFGSAIFHYAVIIVNLKLLIYSRYWTVMFVASVLLSILSMFGFTLLYSILFDIWESNELDIESMYDMQIILYTSLSFWSLLVFCVITSLLPDLTYRYLCYNRIQISLWKCACIKSSKSFNVQSNEIHENQLYFKRDCK